MRLRSNRGSFAAQRNSRIGQRSAVRRNECCNTSDECEDQCRCEDFRRISTGRAVQEMARCTHSEKRQDCTGQHAGEQDTGRLAEDKGLNVTAGGAKSKANSELGPATR